VSQARLQVLRYAAIADPVRHPQAPHIVRDMSRSFLVPNQEAANLEWLHYINATHGCLALWEPGESGRTLRLAGVYGDATGGPAPGDPVAPEDFPPLAWMGDLAGGRKPETVIVVPIVTPDHDWGLLAAILPRPHRYFDGYWALEYGTSLVALALERDAVGSEVGDLTVARQG
jgi:hypothetical protein